MSNVVDKFDMKSAETNYCSSAKIVISHGVSRSKERILPIKTTKSEVKKSEVIKFEVKKSEAMKTELKKSKIEKCEVMKSKFKKSELKKFEVKKFDVMQSEYLHEMSCNTKVIYTSL